MAKISKWSEFRKSMSVLTSKKDNKRINIFLMNNGFLKEPTVFVVFEKSGKETAVFEKNTWEEAVEFAKKERSKEINWR